MTDEPLYEFHAASDGKLLRVAVWDGRKEFSNEIPNTIIRLVGGQKIGIVQVGKPVGPGTGGRSSMALTTALAEMFDGVVHWARDTATYRSIVAEFQDARLRPITPPWLPPGWKPEVVIMPARN